MNFKDAMLELQKGSKVTREVWKGSMYFILEDNHIKSYKPDEVDFTYSEDLMVSGQWVVQGISDAMMFYDIIPYLATGRSARQVSWKHEDYIYYDHSNKKLTLHHMIQFPHSPGFEAFQATDWITLTIS